MTKLNEVADYFLLCPDEGSGDVITHLKLQKLTYYAQAWHIAIYGDELVLDEFEAWAHGPVATSLYSRFAGVGFAPLSKKLARTRVEDSHVVDHLADVWQIYGGYSAKALEQMTHSEDPWIEARGDCLPLERCNTPINRDTMRSYYGEQLSKDEEPEGS